MQTGQVSDQNEWSCHTDTIFFQRSIHFFF